MTNTLYQSPTPNAFAMVLLNWVREVSPYFSLLETVESPVATGIVVPMGSSLLIFQLVVRG